MEFTNTHRALAAIASRAAIGDIDYGFAQVF